MNLREEAEGRMCLIRIPNCCTHNPAETVLCHVRMNSGAGKKPPDQLGAWGCFQCHAAVDGRIQSEYSHDELRLMHLEGMYRTLETLIS